MRPRTSLALLGTAASAAVLAQASSPAPGAGPLTAIVFAPNVGGKIVVERVAAGSSSDPQRWRLNFDVGVSNSSRTKYTLAEAEVCYPGAPVTCKTTSYDTKTAPVVPGGGSVWIQVPETRDHPFPVAPAIRVTLKLGAPGQTEKAVIVSKSLREWESKVAGGGYLFPGRRTDLPDDWYWSDGQNHVYGSNHRNSTSQRFADDLNVRRWDGKAWVTTKPGRTGKANSDWLIWGMPVYAMADGWVLRCFRTVDDNSKPGVEGTGGGNSYRIVHANGEVALYAHFRKGSVPVDLCPKEGVDFNERSAPRVKAGQFLGRAGNSGHSSNPHLHVHLGTTGQEGEQGVPLPFRNVRTRFAGETWAVSKPCEAKNPSFAVSRPPAAVNRRQVIEPLYPSGAPELARHGVREACFQDVADQLAASGYRPFWFDGYDVGGKSHVNAVFRAGSGSWILRTGLTGPAYQSELSAWVRKGYVPSLVEGYRSGDRLRYAFIADKRSSKGFSAYHGRSVADHESLGAAAKKQGMTPVAIAVVSSAGKLYYTGLWERRPLGSWQLKSQLTGPGYQAFLEENEKAGRRLVYVDAWIQDGKPRFSAIVSSSASSTYTARHDLSASAYQAEYEKWRGQGLRTQVVTGYRSGGSHRFAALWR